MTHACTHKEPHVNMKAEGTRIPQMKEHWYLQKYWGNQWGEGKPQSLWNCIVKKNNNNKNYDHHYYYRYKKTLTARRNKRCLGQIPPHSCQKELIFLWLQVCCLQSCETNLYCVSYSVRIAWADNYNLFFTERVTSARNLHRWKCEYGKAVPHSIHLTVPELVWRQGEPNNYSLK